MKNELIFIFLLTIIIVSQFYVIYKYNTKNTLLIGSSIIKKWNNYTSYYPNEKIINKGIIGLTTCDMLEDNYLKSILIRNIQISNIIFYCGSNDIVFTNNSKEIILNNILTIIDILHHFYENTNIVILSIIISPAIKSIHRVNECEYINNKLEKQFYNHKYIRFVDINKILNNEDFIDHMHINTFSYEKINSLL